MPDDRPVPQFGPNGAVLKAPSAPDVSGNAISECMAPTPDLPPRSIKRDLKASALVIAAILGVLIGPSLLLSFVATGFAEVLNLHQNTGVAASKFGLWIRESVLQTTVLFLLFANFHETPRPRRRMWVALISATSGSLGAFAANCPAAPGSEYLLLLVQPLALVFVASGLLTIWLERRFLLSVFWKPVT